MKPLSLYVHWPYCLSKCPYCDFFSLVQDNSSADMVKESYLDDLIYYKNELEGEYTLKTIFFGGGTPSLMPPSFVESIIDTAFLLWPPNQKVEITLEANPNSSEQERFLDFRQAGVNRLSLGIQSFDAPSLLFLGRKHSVSDGVSAIENAKKIFDSFSFDLITALPQHISKNAKKQEKKECLKHWEDQLKFALSFDSPHLSIYQLVIEKGTAFEKMYERGDFEMISDDLMADFYDLTQEQTCAKGLLDYEISNYARLGFESQHNLTYWRYGDYIGIGPGAHSRYKVKDIKIHEENTKNIEIYNKKISNQKKCQKWQKNRQTDSLKTISIDRSYKKRRILMKKDEFVEHVMMSLRLKEGLDLRSLVAPIFNYIDEEKISSLIKEGLCCLENNKLFLTKRGRPLHQAVLRYIL